MAEKEEFDRSTKIRFHVFPDDRFVDFSIYQFGWEQCEPRHSFGPAVRNHYLLHYIISGKGILESDDAKKQNHHYELHEGQAFLICPTQVNTYHADAEDPWKYTWIEFDGLRVKEALDQAGLNINQPIFHPVSREASLRLQELMLHMVEYGNETELHLTGYGFLFLDQLVKASTTKREKSQKRVQDFYLREAMNYIEQRYAEDISVEDIAAFCGLNRSYFGRIFKESMGQTPQEFLMNYRITKACQLLKSTRLSIGEIAESVGYPNQLHFSRAFHNVIGVSPRAWRNEHFEL